MKVPCKNCNDRHIGCHSKCEAYKEYTVQVKAVNEAEYNSKKFGKFGDYRNAYK